MAELCIVSAAELVPGAAEEVSCTVEVAAGDKCPRCWNVRDLGEGGLCARCHEALAATGEL
jgi:isoleucyl-tRNA synthetase